MTHKIDDIEILLYTYIMLFGTVIALMFRDPKP
jgi:hypothetical protein